MKKVRFDATELEDAISYIVNNNPHGFSPAAVRQHMYGCAKSIAKGNFYCGTMGFLLLAEDESEETNTIYVKIWVDPNIGHRAEEDYLDSVELEFPEN